MVTNIEIEQVNVIEEYISDLSDLLIHVVDDNASVGFLPPLRPSEATNYWQNVLSPEIILLIAKIDEQLVGTVQLHLCTKQNGGHRAEIAKLMTHPTYRRNGIGRLLMERAIERAKQEGRSLLVLDTREGDSSNQLYVSLGFIKVGHCT